LARFNAAAGGLVAFGLAEEAVVAGSTVRVGFGLEAAVCRKSFVSKQVWATQGLLRTLGCEAVVGLGGAEVLGGFLAGAAEVALAGWARLVLSVEAADGLAVLGALAVAAATRLAPPNVERGGLAIVEAFLGAAALATGIGLLGAAAAGARIGAAKSPSLFEYSRRRAPLEVDSEATKSCIK